MTTAQAAGDLAALVNCAARTDVRDLFEITPEEWDDVLATNLRGPFLGIQAVGPTLRRRGEGRIVSIASDSAFRGRGVTGAHYATSKAGLLALTRRAAAALAPSGVTVNAVAPGTIDGETVRELAGDRLDELSAEVPAGRLGRPEEIAAIVAWLLSDEAAYVNGATLLVDGGAALSSCTRTASPARQILTFGVPALSLCDGHTKPTAGLTESTLTSPVWNLPA